MYPFKKSIDYGTYSLLSIIGQKLLKHNCVLTTSHIRLITIEYCYINLGMCSYLT